MNENHLLETMGLTIPEENDLEELFSPELQDFLKNSEFID